MARCRDFSNMCGIEELRAIRQLIKSLVAEFLGTGLLVLIGCGSCIGWIGESPSVVQIALAFGLSVAIVVQCVGPVSGGHLNPAVTCALMITGRCSILRSFLYILIQCAGAIASSATLKAIVPPERRGSLGATLVNPSLTAGQACGVEAAITFLLVLTVFAVTDQNRLDNLAVSGPLAVGLSVVAGHCFAVSYTGASMNTARAFGPAVIMGNWTKHWVYWAGPILGGCTAGLLYHHVFAASPAEPEMYDRLKIQSLLRIREKEIIAEKMTCL